MMDQYWPKSDGTVIESNILTSYSSHKLGCKTVAWVFDFQVKRYWVRFPMSQPLLCSHLLVSDVFRKPLQERFLSETNSK